MEVKWFIDSWAVWDGSAFASRRDPGEDFPPENTQTVFMGAPHFAPIPVSNYSTALAAARTQGFQEKYLDSKGNEVEFENLEQVITAVRAAYRRGGGTRPEGGAPGFGPTGGPEGGGPLSDGPDREGGSDEPGSDNVRKQKAAAMARSAIARQIEQDRPNKQSYRNKVYSLPAHDWLSVFAEAVRCVLFECEKQRYRLSSLLAEPRQMIEMTEMLAFWQHVWLCLASLDGTRWSDEWLSRAVFFAWGSAEIQECVFNGTLWHSPAVGYVGGGVTEGKTLGEVVAAICSGDLFLLEDQEVLSLLAIAIALAVTSQKRLMELTVFSSDSSSGANLNFTAGKVAVDAYLADATMNAVEWIIEHLRKSDLKSNPADEDVQKLNKRKDQGNSGQSETGVMML